MMEKRNQTLLAITVFELLVMLIGYITSGKEGLIIAVIWSIPNYITYILCYTLMTLKPKKYPTLITAIGMIIITAILVALILILAIIGNVRNMQSAMYIYIATAGILIGFLLAVIIQVINYYKNKKQMANKKEML